MQIRSIAEQWSPLHQSTDSKMRGQNGHGLDGAQDTRLKVRRQTKGNNSHELDWSHITTSEQGPTGGSSGHRRNNAAGVMPVTRLRDYNQRAAAGTD